MGFNRDNYIKIKREYEGKALRAEEAARQRRDKLHLLVPEISEIDFQLALTGMKVYEATLSYKGEELKRQIDILKSENLALQEKRAELLVKNGLPPDYSDVKYECKKCSDSGFEGLKMCACMREKLVFAGYESSGIGRLIQSKTFENFNPNAQPEGEVRENITLIYNYCKHYAESFDTSACRNLLMIGATGLGKTHLSTAIAGRVISRGFDVVCETTQNIFGDFEYERFGKGYGASDAEGKRTDKYFECDLLIIDDLGVEVTNQFTVSCLYNIINTRLNRGCSTIINTNLTKDELYRRYTERIASRLFGEFRPIAFMGRDMREQLL